MVFPWSRAQASFGFTLFQPLPFSTSPAPPALNPATPCPHLSTAQGQPPPSSPPPGLLRPCSTPVLAPRRLAPGSAGMHSGQLPLGTQTTPKHSIEFGSSKAVPGGSSTQGRTTTLRTGTTKGKNRSHNLGNDL